MEHEGFRGGESFLVLGPDGEALPLHRFLGAEHAVVPRGELIEGRSEVVGVSDRAARVLLLRGDSRVAEEDVRLLAGELTVVRFR